MKNDENQFPRAISKTLRRAFRQQYILEMNNFRQQPLQNFSTILIMTKFNSRRIKIVLKQLIKYNVLINDKYQFQMEQQRILFFNHNNQK
ncbi:hypothetical protein pb186bvf_005840 [Paramecium bursaria]